MGSVKSYDTTRDKLRLLILGFASNKLAELGDDNDYYENDYNYWNEITTDLKLESEELAFIRSELKRLDEAFIEAAQSQYYEKASAFRFKKKN